MNIKAAEKVLAHLRRLKTTKRAARFNMRYWGDVFDDDMDGVLQKPVCGTQACLGGETVLALRLGSIAKGGGIFIKNNSACLGIVLIAQHALDLTEDEKNRLFYLKSWGLVHGWPDEFDVAYKAAKTPRKRLSVAIARLEHFISTNGAE